MPVSGLIQESFRTSLHSITLRFKDPFLERSYISARTSMALGPGSRRVYLLFTLASYIIMFTSASSLDIGFDLSDPKNQATIAICTILTVFIMAAEALCYFCRGLHAFRGVATTVVGCFATFNNNLASFEPQVFYPYIGTAYSFSSIRVDLSCGR